MTPRSATSTGPATARAPSRATALFDERYEWSARWDGDIQPKKDAAAAKRTATSLRTAVKTFETLLSSEQLAAMLSAAAAMTELGTDLDQVCRMANKRKTEFAAEEDAKRKGAADSLAAARWADDEAAMFDEAASLANFFDAWQGLGVEAWILSRQRPGLKYANLPNDLPAGGRLLDMLARFKETKRKESPLATDAAALAIRRRAAEYLKALRTVDSTSRFYKDMYYVGADDYEAWRAWTAGIRAAVVPPMTSKPSGEN